MTDQTKEQKKRRIIGTVVSNKMDKTAVVRVDRTLIHEKYGKRYKTSKRLMVHDPANSLTVGETVTIEEMRPMSKEKRWRIVGKA